MKKLISFLSVVLLLVVVVPVLTGCKTKREDLKFDGEDGEVIFNVKKGSNYKISKDKKDLRTTREEAALVADNFKIGIEFDNDYKYFFDSDFEKLKKAREDYDDFKEVTYNGMKAVQYFSGGYNCYNIMIPATDSEEYMLILTVYGKEDKEKAAKDAFKLDEVQDVLNNLTFSIKDKK